METIFEAYDAEALELVWRSLSKVYNQTLHKMGDIDFSVEHSGVRKRQRAGTLERVEKYEKEALDKAWAWMASSPSDGEEEKHYFPPTPPDTFLAPQVSSF